MRIEIEDGDPEFLSREENRSAPLTRGGGQNARATGGPGILPVTNWSHGISRMPDTRGLP
jgi:hypothetical protein